MNYRAKSVISICVGFLLLFGLPSQLIGQESNDEWPAPVNLSQSGSASDPQVVVDGRAIVHIFWPDRAVNSFFYTRGTHGAWLDSVQVEVPFGSRQNSSELEQGDTIPLYEPSLVADQNGFIHAFWKNGDGALFHSRVPINQVENFDSWSPQQQLAASAADFVAASDDRGSVFLGYISNESGGDLPAGIYHRQLAAGAEGWSQPQSLYSSAYLQDLPEGQANIDLVISENAGSPSLFVTWDDRLQEKVFLSTSTNGGNNWEQPLVVDERQPDDGVTSIGPSNIRAAAGDDTVLLLWQAGHRFDSCSQYFQVSTDGGSTWGEPETMLDENGGCADELEFIGSANDLLLLEGTIQGGDFMLAWGGGMWSDPQPLGIDSFTHPETFRIVDFSCKQIIVTDQSELLLIGCGTANEVETTDIWATSRPAGDSSEWFPPESTWEEPFEIAQGTAAIHSPQIVVDSQGRSHAFWIQAEGDEGSRRAIFYSRQENAQWTPPIRIMSSDSGDIVQARAAIGSGDRLMLAWIDEAGAAYFSQTSADQATQGADWSTPIQLPVPETSLSDLDIANDQLDSIYIAYTIPINEFRGIYLVRSGDEGRSWTEPTPVFDGAEASWEMVGPVRLSVSGGGNLQLVWPKLGFEAVEGQSRAEALYYTRSLNGSGPFSEPAAVDETVVNWSDLVNSNGVVHRLWQEIDGTTGTVFHQYSTNEGANWSTAVRVINSINPVAADADSSGQLHLIEAGNGALNHMVWGGVGWDREEQVDLPNSLDGVALHNLYAADGPVQQLAVLLTGPADETEQEQPIYSIYSTWRNIDSPEDPLVIATVPSNPEPSPTPTEETVIEVEPATPEPSPDPTEEPETIEDPINEEGALSRIIDLDNPIIKWTIVAIPVVFLLAAVVVLAFWYKRS